MIDWVVRYLTDTVFEKHIISGSWPIRVRFKEKKKETFPHSEKDSSGGDLPQNTKASRTYR